MTLSPRLMSLNLAEPHQKYRLASGQEVPGVTTIGRVINKPQLIKWANEMGKKGIDTDAFVQKAADIGTIIHARAEAYLRGYDGLDPAGIPEDLYAKSEIPYTRFLERWNDRGLKVVASECQLVSERLRVGGTLDIMAEDPELGLGLVDLKSSNPYVKWTGRKRLTDLDMHGGLPMVQPYRDVKTQLGGYSLLWTENHPDHPIKWSRLWRLGKEEGDPGQVHAIDDLGLCEDAFRKAVDLHYALYRIE